VLGDILPEGSSRPGTWVVSIEKIVRGETTLGFIYGMKDQVKLIQAIPAMPQDMREKLELQPFVLKRLATLPKDLRVVPCTATDWTRH